MRTLATWLAVLLAAAAMLAITGFETRDADSRAYIAIAARLADQPASRWIAPQWWGAWGGQGPFREHPAGTFVPPALLTRAGYPAAQSLFVVTLACQIVALLAFSALARRLVPASHARTLLWALQLIPIAFVFRVRANQEYLLLAGLMVSVYAVERARTAPWWTVAAVGGTAFAVLVKGVFGVLAVPLAGLWLWARRSERGLAPGAYAVFLAVALTPIALSWIYERAYVAVTGQSFLDYYLGSRIGLDGGDGGLTFPLDKASNALWYLGRLLWFAAPWTIVVPIAAWRRADGVSRGTRAFIGFALAGAAVTLALVAARDTKADRYIFPAYLLVASAGVVVACARWPAAARFADRLERYQPWGPAVLWLLLVGGRVLIG